MIRLKKHIDYVKHARWRSEPSTLIWTRESSDTTPDEQKRYFESLPKDKHFFGVFDMNSWQVGTAGLTDVDLVNRTAEFSLLIGPEHRNKGYGKEALINLVNYGFRVLNLETIWGETFCYPTEAFQLLKQHQNTNILASSIYEDVKQMYYINPAALVFGKVGFQKEGLLRDRYYKYGFKVSTIVCSVTRKLWTH